jgi:hypothetical protein
MNDNNIIDITVVFANEQTRTLVANAMADATVEARGRLQYLSERQDSRAKDMKYALRVLEHISSCVAELQTLDG